MEAKEFIIMLVEDDLNDIFLIKRAFKKANPVTPLQVVTDGQDAIDYLQGQGKYANRESYPLPSLVVTDINMPRFNGFELIKWVRSQSGPLRRLPIVIVSSSGSQQDINHAYELGANAYMVKPVDYRLVEHIFEVITNYWTWECAKPELQPA